MVGKFTLKDRILKFLKSNENKEYTVSQLSREINSILEKSVSYGTVLKYCDILIAEGSIQVKDFGAVKVIYYGEKKDDQTRVK